MEKQYTVTITKKHCENAQYFSCTDCPVFRAVKEQLPDFPLKSVGGWYIRDTSGVERRFEKENENVWSLIHMKQLMSDEIDKVVLTF